MFVDNIVDNVEKRETGQICDKKREEKMV